jgi:hypothetical protein
MESEISGLPDLHAREEALRLDAARLAIVALRRHQSQQQAV